MFSIEQRLLAMIPKEQKERVLGQPDCDIDGSFLGFIEEYEHLSKIIPKHFTVIDLGCAFNPQSFYFTEHKEYIAVDFWKNEKFMPPNCTFFEKTIQEFIAEDLHRFDLDETFAICSYVPTWHGDNREMVRKAFRNLFVYYPHGGHKELFIKKPNI